MSARKILIIDDDQKNIFALGATLKARGFENLNANNAGDGISLLENDPGIGIVLLDMMMPGMDGYEAISVIRQNDRIKHVTVIAVTAQAMQGDRERCLQAGADDYISKPINVDVLIKTLMKFLN